LRFTSSLFVLSAIVLGGSLAPAATIANPTTITIPVSGSEGPADPYPSTISVAGLGLINSITVDIFGLTHSFPDDIDILYPHWMAVVRNDAERRKVEETLERYFTGDFDSARATYLIGTPDEIVDAASRSFLGFYR